MNEKPQHCKKCGTSWGALHWSNAAGTWVCLDCHCLAQAKEA